MLVHSEIWELTAQQGSVCPIRCNVEALAHFIVDQSNAGSRVTPPVDTYHQFRMRTGA